MMPPELRPCLLTLLREGVWSWPTHGATLHALMDRGLVDRVSVAGGRTDVRLTAEGRVRARLLPKAAA